MSVDYYIACFECKEDLVYGNYGHLCYKAELEHFLNKHRRHPLQSFSENDEIFYEIAEDQFGSGKREWTDFVMPKDSIFRPEEETD